MLPAVDAEPIVDIAREASLRWCGRRPCGRDGRPGPARVAPAPSGIDYPIVERKLRKRRLLLTTKTEENAIAAPASIGFNRPAMASGIAATL